MALLIDVIIVCNFRICFSAGNFDGLNLKPLPFVTCCLQLRTMRIRSGNALLLKGDKEAGRENAIMHRTIVKARKSPRGNEFPCFDCMSSTSNNQNPNNMHECGSTTSRTASTHTRVLLQAPFVAIAAALYACEETTPRLIHTFVFLWQLERL
jgi:hypothetical protein